MSLNLSNIKTNSKRQKTKRIGRGGKRGTYSGRGMKGQKARSGTSGLKRLGLRQLVEQTHKLKGFNSRRPRPQIVNLDKIDAKFNDGEKVNPESLEQKNLITTAGVGVKILSRGEISKKVEIQNCLISKQAKEKIEKAGGKIL